MSDKELEIKEESDIKQENVVEQPEIKKEETQEIAPKDECIIKHDSSELTQPNDNEIKEEAVIKVEPEKMEEPKIEASAFVPISKEKPKENNEIVKKVEINEDEAPRRSVRANPNKSTTTKEDLKKPSTNTAVSTTPSIIDLHKLNKKAHLDHSDCIYVIFEVTTNSKKYGLEKSSKSSAFWDKLKDMHIFTKILEIYKTETLRKYWRCLADVENPSKILEIVKEYQEAIDGTNLRLLTVINLLVSYANNKITDLKDSLGYDDTNKYNNKEKDKNDDEEEGSAKLTNQKRNKEKVETMLMLSKSEIAELDLSTEKVLRSAKSKTPSQMFTATDKSNFEQIEDIVSTLSKHLPECTNKRIIEALKMNSFNVINTYLYLKDSEKYESKPS